MQLGDGGEKPVVEATPVWTAKAQRAYPPDNPDDPFSVGRIEPVELRLYDDPTGYRLAMLVAGADDGEETIWTGHDPTGFGLSLAMKRIKVDKDVDHSPLHQLAKVHPAEIRRRERLEQRIANLPMGGSGEGRRREIYRDRDVTGQPSTWPTARIPGADHQEHPARSLPPERRGRSGPRSLIRTLLLVGGVVDQGLVDPQRVVRSGHRGRPSVAFAYTINLHQTA